MHLLSSMGFQPDLIHVPSTARETVRDCEKRGVARLCVCVGVRVCMQRRGMDRAGCVMHY